MSSEIKVSSVKAKDGTAGISIADSTGNVSLSGSLSAVTIGSSVNFNPSIGQLAFYSHFHSPSSTITCTLDGTSTYLVVVNGRRSTSPYHPLNLTFKIDSSDGTITEGSDPWGADLNESFNNSTKVLSMTCDSDTEIMTVLIFKGSVAEMT